MTDYRDHYREVNQRDEILYYTGWDFDAKLRMSFRKLYDWDEGDQMNPLETNHIFTNPRRDLRSMLIRVRRHTHEYFHKHLTEGRILCLVSKLRKRAMLNDPEEFVLAEAERCASFCRSLRGWAESQHFGTATFRELQAECVELLLDLELEEAWMNHQQK